MDKPTVLLGVIGSDCHAVGNKILEKIFSDGGFNVFNLGVMVTHDEFLDAAVETDAKAILVSSIYGHGELDCEGFRDRAIERGLDSLILYVGGNLVIGKTDVAVVKERFRKMGFDRVFTPDDDLEEAVRLLWKDIRKRFGSEQ